MERSETAKLVVFSASVEGREATEIEMGAWHQLVGDLDYQAAMCAAREHYLSQSRRLWPADLIRACGPSFDELAAAGLDWTEFPR